MKKIVGIVCLVFIGLQFIPRPKKNNAAVSGISPVFQTNPRVLAILEKSCLDCHSNNTTYPWYASVQPLSMWINNHIEEGKDELNFAEFHTYSLKKQQHKLKELVEQVEEGEMPMSSYTLIHRSARLTSEEKKTLIDWTNNQISPYKPNDEQH